ncbi:hypothetical protein LX77_01827 [Gelidibacter algens]|uniref:Lipoprotein n=1 Tax=Gelidibacter algens TaxID=49280 RepID=A0A1A7R6B2_9FLAO|nr:hypothetical protein [Gelidibacter algens]OBX26287.1 hypothetical protein A9996_05800 [Gelidibacter algens]RAJ24828.1 hypothetical protein LX77_01827 [Gelidibacter algens]
MKKFLLFTLLVTLLVSCSGKKQIAQALHSGNYNQAIGEALRKLENNKDKDRKQDFVVLLKTAYEKAAERDLKNINHLKKDGNPEHYKAIYDLYLNLDARQEAIKPVLPLKVNGKNIQFSFTDYSNAIVDSRLAVSEHMYKNGLALLDSDIKDDLKEAYSTFQYIDHINPKYKDTRNLMEASHKRGTDYIIVTIENQTDQIIPKRLEDDLLNFDTYGLNQFWTVYHANPAQDLDYDYAMVLQLKRINVSPEKLHEKEVLREKEFVDGWNYKLDRAGNVAKDSLGNDIKIDKIVQARARYFEYHQLKSTQVIADIVYLDLRNNQTLDVFPISSEFVFENFYAIVKGDKRALNQNDLDLLQNKRLRFPSDADMVYDTGEDLKLKLKQIISTYKI